jgi:hypothetical protein
MFFAFNDAHVCLCATFDQVQVAQAVAKPFADLTTLHNLKSKRAQSNKEARASKKAAEPEPPAKKSKAAAKKGRQAPKKATQNTKQV